MKNAQLTLKDEVFGLSVTDQDTNLSFWLQGDDANQFRNEWNEWQQAGDDDLSSFLSIFGYDVLFQ